MRHNISIEQTVSLTFLRVGRIPSDIVCQFVLTKRIYRIYSYAMLQLPARVPILVYIVEERTHEQFSKSESESIKYKFGRNKDRKKRKCERKKWAHEAFLQCE